MYLLVYNMHCIVYILLIFSLLQVSSVPSGLKIVKERIANQDEYPFIVRLERQIILSFSGKIESEDNIHICTCAVLTQSWTVTAGHCIDSAGPVKDLTENLRIKSVLRYGPHNGTIANVISTLQHPSFKDRVRGMQNDIGLLRTEPIRLKQYAQISALDTNTLGGQEVILTGYGNFKPPTGIAVSTLSMRNPLMVLKLVIVRYDKTNEYTHSTVCVAKRCIPSSTSICPADSGGPMLHQTGIIGINSLSLENVKLCSLTNKNGLIEMGVLITPTNPYIKWINNNIKRDDLIS